MNIMSIESTILKLNQKLLNAIASGDFETYSSLCATDLTCFEPETKGVVVQGIAFHKYYFDLDQALASSSLEGPSIYPKNNVSMASPHVRVLGENVVILSYTRLNQSLDKNLVPISTMCCETRVWEKRDKKWVHVHFHKSS